MRPPRRVSRQDTEWIGASQQEAQKHAPEAEQKIAKLATPRHNSSKKAVDVVELAKRLKSAKIERDMQARATSHTLRRGRWRSAWRDMLSASDRVGQLHKRSEARRGSPYAGRFGPTARDLCGGEIICRTTTLSLAALETLPLAREMFDAPDLARKDRTFHFIHSMLTPHHSMTIQVEFDSPSALSRLRLWAAKDLMRIWGQKNFGVRIDKDTFYAVRRSAAVDGGRSASSTPSASSAPRPHQHRSPTAAAQAKNKFRKAQLEPRRRCRVPRPRG